MKLKSKIIPMSINNSTKSQVLDAKSTKILATSVLFSLAGIISGGWKAQLAVSKRLSLYPKLRIEPFLTVLLVF